MQRSMIAMALGASLLNATPISIAIWASPADAQSQVSVGKTPPDATPAPPVDQQACLKKLSDQGAQFEALPDIGGPCPAVNIIRLTAIERGLALRPAAIMTCAMAERLSLWVRTGLVPASLDSFDEAPIALSIGASYVCRNENGLAGGKLSEHAKANAVDLTGLVFKTHDLRVANLAPGSREHALFGAIRASACLYFTTVLGPGTDWQHADNLHLDLRQRRKDYRICQ
jgi:hypothetical protein